jgi:Retrotransposon gag protein/Zinc knuckle
MSDVMEETSGTTPISIPSEENILAHLLQSLAQGQANMQQLMKNQQELYAKFTTPNSEKPKSRVAAPDAYDGSPEKLDPFLRQLYLTFSDDPTSFRDPMRKIRFALSYMKEKFALQWANRIIGELEDGSRTYDDWKLFRQDLISAFANPNKKEQAQRKLEQLRQGGRPAEEFFVEFEEYKAFARYNDEGYVALLKRNLNSGIVRRIYELETVPETYEKWKQYALRFDQNYREYQSLMTGPKKQTDQNPRRYSDRHNTTPTPSEPPPTPKSVDTGAGQPMDIDRYRSTIPEKRTCYNCGKAGHISKNCRSERAPRVQQFRMMYGALSPEERVEFQKLVNPPKTETPDFPEN